MRLFTAIDPTENVREAIAELRDRLKEAGLEARWTNSEQYHLTVRFIGEVDDDTGHAYQEALEGLPVPPVTVQPYGLDVLPARRHPRVIMVGVKRSDDLMRLYESVSRRLEEAGLDPETRDYRPHLTLARIDDPDPKAVHEAMRAVEPVDVPAFDANELIVYQSHLGPGGATHEPVERIRLDA